MSCWCICVLFAVFWNAVNSPASPSWHADDVCAIAGSAALAHQPLYNQMWACHPRSHGQRPNQMFGVNEICRTMQQIL
ncbi:hypothetical protein PYCCODRAFT_1432548 [Trametes coccinea BRFM310]|uniref:Secreted protein n=1 Tax=Trametes coccinea (strain BRFM310) TaxID=1353009 RepID=A0A1Y2IXQ8_TRAC3|nr:hypothetical protein PYCCODRAFT_1432548 [Trametes coccinea BRFM310]